MAKPLLSGCYSDPNGVPILQIEGHEAEFLIPSDVRRVHLTWGKDSVGRYANAKPAFLLVEGPESDRIEKNDASPNIRLPITGDPPAIGVPDAPEGYLSLKRGKSCSQPLGAV